MSNVTVADLTEGTPVRHIESGTTGTIHAEDGNTWITWERGPLADTPVGRVWPVSPSDLEIIGEAP